MAGEAVQVIPVDTVQAQKIGNGDLARLRRNVLSPNAKREQLWGKGIRGKDAEDVLEQIYGA